MTIRYFALLTGASYAPYDLSEPSHAIACDSLSDARELASHLCSGSAARWRDGNGERVLDTPAFGYAGDIIDLYAVPVTDPDYATVQAILGETERLAWSWMIDAHSDDSILHDTTPDYRITVGPRGGLNLEAC